MTPSDYTAIRCGMNVSKAIINKEIDAGIGLENVQMVELEEWLAGQGRPKSDCQMLRIDELAELGCCCFCTILYIGEWPSSLFLSSELLISWPLGNESFISQNPEKVSAFMRAIKKATDYVLASPAAAFAEFVEMKPVMGTPVNRKIFERSYAYFSKDLKNVERDWTKVTKYGKRLGVLDKSFKPNYTNEFLQWDLESESEDPNGDQKRMVELQKDVAEKGGFCRLPVTPTIKV